MDWATRRERVWNTPGGLGAKLTWKWATWGMPGNSRMKKRGPNLSELHHHVGKHVQESHYSIPEAAMCQALLVPGAGALGGAEGCSEHPAGGGVQRE